MDCKVSITTTLDKGFAVGTRSLLDTPSEGHTLNTDVKQIEFLTERLPNLVVDGGALFAVLCGCGHNIRQILAWPQAVLAGPRGVGARHRIEVAA